MERFYEKILCLLVLALAIAGVCLFDIKKEIYDFNIGGEQYEEIKVAHKHKGQQGDYK